LNNCKFGLHGPIEIFSRNAVQAWAQGRETCVKHFNQVCDGPCWWGEDMFMDQCLSKVLNVKRDNNSFVLIEDHCDPPAGWTDCTDPMHVAFHPFKKLKDYQECMDNAESVCPRPVSTTLTTTLAALTAYGTAATNPTSVADGGSQLLAGQAATTVVESAAAMPGCEAACVDYANPQGTCRSHIQWVADQTVSTASDPCKEAYTLTLQQCSACQSCALESSGCVQPQIPVQPTTPLPRASPSEEDCEVDFSNWEWMWSDDKMAWCCKHTGRGCVKSSKKDRFDCDEDFIDWEGAWSAQKKSWCCDQVGRGCQVFDCSEDFADWARGWSLDKRTWCCKHEQRGCQGEVESTSSS